MIRTPHLSLLLVAPLLLLILVGFVGPLVLTGLKAVENPEVSAALPRTVAALARWDGTGLPDEAAFAALAADMDAEDTGRAFGAMTRRLNFEASGTRTLLLQTRRAAPGLTAPYRDSLPRLDPAWAEPATWALIRTHSSPLTASYVLRALDLRLTPEGRIAPVPEGQAIFVDLFLRTFVISVVVTALSVALGYPTAWFLSTLEGRAERIALLCVLVPFWISILVRSTAWFILLQREGPLNGLLLQLGLIEAPRAVIFTRAAVYIAMVHVLLPFFILPLLSVMKRIRPDYLRAAASLGARPWRQFVHVYLPLTMPGVAAGAVMVLMLSVGFYITPVLVGGLQDQMISYYIAEYTNVTINTGMAAALSLWLLLLTGLLVALAARLLPGATAGLRSRGG